jgi:uncharacterized protein YndB with AHSA1/START domain
VLAVDPPRRLEMNDGFADDTGKPNDDMPVGRMVVTLDERDGRTEMVITSHFPSLETMEQVLAMGQEEGRSRRSARSRGSWPARRPPSPRAFIRAAAPEVRLLPRPGPRGTL